MKDISIVTAFYDIGRGNWTSDKGHPHYLYRPREVYFERFEYLTRLANDITVVTAPELVDSIIEYIGNKPNVNVVGFDLMTNMAGLRQNIAAILNSPGHKSQINPRELVNPEYWNADYVLVTSLKAFFVQYAIEKNLPKQDMVAWIDFGYCRSERNVLDVPQWTVDFDDDHIHMFSYKPYDGKDLLQIIRNNEVYILGAKIVANKKLWNQLNVLMLDSHMKLMQNDLVDDDQGLWLSTYIQNPDLFTLHTIPDHQLGHDPFVLFQKFNTSYE